MKLHEALATGKRCRRPGMYVFIVGAADKRWYAQHASRYPCEFGGTYWVTDAQANLDDWYCEGDPSGIHSPFHRDMFGGIGGSYRWVNDGPSARCHPEAHAAVDTGMRWGFCSRCDTDLEFTSDGWIERQRA